MADNQPSDIPDWQTAWQRKKGKRFLEFEKQQNHPIRKLIVKKTIEVGASVLDIGCATCNDYLLFRETPVKYYGRDFTPKFVKRAKQRFPDVDVELANVFDIPFEDNSIDVVYCKDLLEHLPPKKYKKAIKEMWRVTRKRMMIAFFKAPYNGETKYQIIRKLHWNNQYSKTDIVHALILDNVADIEIIDNIGNNNSTLYVVDKNEFPAVIQC